MGLTLSHLSALDITRTLRSEGRNLREMESIPLRSPSPWVGKRWSKRDFDPSVWQWLAPSREFPMDVLVPKGTRSLRMKNVNVHMAWKDLPRRSVLQIDENTSIVCPELLFLQASSFLSLPALVMLGLELCGHFSRSAEAPLEGKAAIEIPVATCVKEIASFLDFAGHQNGIARAKDALRYVSDHALSPPEAVLASMYSLPPKECGYGMGPVVLNKRICTDGKHKAKSRYPDLLFSFAPLGINYDGEDHLDLQGLVQAAREAERADGEQKAAAEKKLNEKMRAVRAKVVDDTRRNRQLATKGYFVLPTTKEDLYGNGCLDRFTEDLLACARSLYGINTDQFEKTLNDTEKTRDRNDLLKAITPSGGKWGESHGRI